jgi:hypothetical protein
MGLSASNALVVIDRVTPLPPVLARAAIDEAQTVRDKDRALKLLATARNELVRAKEPLCQLGSAEQYELGISKSVWGFPLHVSPCHRW